ncbi:MAG: RNA polymerase sigma factor, partial [Oscillospiraceae bacterium]|nr:RNA polymerase sigma factor [Oscillospiraceae bacterium]
MDDSKTMEQLRKREQKALEEIIKKYNQYVSIIVYKILCGYSAEIDMQGVVNEIFFRLWENADKLDIQNYTD